MLEPLHPDPDPNLCNSGTGYRLNVHRPKPGACLCCAPLDRILGCRFSRLGFVWLVREMRAGQLCRAFASSLDRYARRKSIFGHHYTELIQVGNNQRKASPGGLILHGPAPFAPEKGCVKRSQAREVTFYIHVPRSGATETQASMSTSTDMKCREISLQGK